MYYSMNERMNECCLILSTNLSSARFTSNFQNTQAQAEPVLHNMRKNKKHPDATLVLVSRQSASAQM